MLEEVSGSLGLAVFIVIRAALLWHQVGPSRHDGLYADGAFICQLLRLAAEEAPQLARALETFARLVAAPVTADARDLADACIQMSEWATEQGFGATALEAAETAAALRPRDPGLAFIAGRTARQQAVYERAEQWFDRAIGVARRVGERVAYTDALIGWGILAFQRGRHAEARVLFLRAYRSAQKGDIRRLGAAAQHNLLLLAVEDGELSAAGRHAALAARLYGADDARFPVLAHDTAHLWATQDFYGAALPVYRAALPFITAVPERVQAFANIAEAAGVLGDADSFFEAWDYVSRHARAAGPFLAISLLCVAEGARSLGYSLRACNLAQQAQTAARQRQQADAELAANRLLNEIRDGDPARVARPPPTDVANLSDHFIRILTRSA